MTDPKKALDGAVYAGELIRQAKETVVHESGITAHDLAYLTTRTKRGMREREKREALRKCHIDPENTEAIDFLIAKGAITPLRISFFKRIVSTLT